MKINLLIPCYNEGESIEILYEKIKQFNENHKLDINFFILDNGSTDDTSQKLNLLKSNEKINFIKLIENKGYGYGIKFGLNEISNADMVGWFHGDLQFEINNLVKIYEQIEDEMKKGDELLFFKGIRYGRNSVSTIFSFLMGIFATLFLRYRFYEINAQPTIFSSNLISKLDMSPNDFSFDTYIYFLAKKNNFKFLRTKVSFPKREFGQSKWDFGLISKIKFSIKNIKYIIRLSRD